MAVPIPSRWLLALRALCLFLVAGASHATEPVQATDREVGLYLLKGPNGWSIGARDGGRSAVQLPTGFIAYRLEGLSGGWIATGTVVVDSFTELALVRGGDGVEVLPAPEGRFGRERDNPVPLIVDGDLRGVAWVEGDRQEELAVMAAEWLGNRWGTPTVVSPPGPGSQLALSGAVLDNGDWLLVWAGFDGEDDEILWSRGDSGGWTAPERIGPNNSVPDIVPSVIATPSGAIAVWSGYDGRHYRLRTAHLEGSEWRVDGYSGAPGSLFPQAMRADGRPLVLYSTVIPEGWSLAELGRPGPVGELRAPVPTGIRPIVMPRHGDRPELVWQTVEGDLLRVDPEPVEEASLRDGSPR